MGVGPPLSLKFSWPLSEEIIWDSKVGGNIEEVDRKLPRKRIELRGTGKQIVPVVEV